MEGRDRMDRMLNKNLREFFNITFNVRIEFRDKMIRILPCRNSA